MATNKQVIDFLTIARPIILDLTEDNIKIIADDKDLMQLLRRKATEFEKDWGEKIGIATSIAPYNSIGWYLASSLREDIQHYYRIKHRVTMAEFLQMKYGDMLPKRADSEFGKRLSIEEYKRYFGKDLHL